jgi:multidomain signaling protein FimX
LNEQHGISVAVLSRNQEDVESVNVTLRSSGHAAHCHWVADPASFDELLGGDSIELVVLYKDHYADEIRQVVRQKDAYQPELPVIVVQPEIDEPAIQAAMKEGARDLVSANRRSRWLAVMERELRALRLERALNSTVNAANEYKRQLHDYMERSESAIAYAQDGIITSANSAWVELFQAASEDEVAGLPLMDSFETESHAAIKGALVATMKGKWQSGDKLDAKARTSRGEASKLELCFQQVEFEDGPHIQVEIALRAAVVEEPTKLVHDALKRDPTTLFYHRQQFLERLQKRTSKKLASGMHILACIQPDHFSTIQKDVGIVASEEILALLAEQVRSRLHPRDFAGRFEGTALMVLLERGNENDAQVWGQQLIDHIREYEFRINDQVVHITCTIGICAVTGVFNTLEEQIAAVMAAKREGRAAGGNTVCLNDTDNEDTRLRRFDAIWVKHIRSALMDNRFRLAHLPIAGLRSESGAMFDMLVRMLDEQGNSVLPSEFLPAAERNNLMKTIDRWILTASMDFCAEEKADKVFVRLSRQSLKDGTLAEWVKQEIGKRRISASNVCLQIAERDAAKHIKLAQTLAADVRKAGIGFALAHYGVDKNRLQILDMLKPDFIKIDGELMHSLTGDTEMQENVRALAAAADERGIMTIAERVENANAMAVLFQLGVHFMQGHYVHEPEVVLAEPPSVATNSYDAIVNN